MQRNIIFNIATESKAPPQVFLSLNAANGPELGKTSHVLFAVKQ